MTMMMTTTTRQQLLTRTAARTDLSPRGTKARGWTWYELQHSGRIHTSNRGRRARCGWRGWGVAEVARSEQLSCVCRYHDRDTDSPITDHRSPTIDQDSVYSVLSTQYLSAGQERTRRTTTSTTRVSPHASPHSWGSDPGANPATASPPEQRGDPHIRGACPRRHWGTAGAPVPGRDNLGYQVRR